MTKILFLCGGSLSGIGKGTISAIIYNILQKNNIKCKYIKIDPYLNINIEHMDSKEHGLYYKINNNYYGDVDLYYLSRHCNIDETNSVSLGKIIQLMHQHSDSTKTLQVINNIVDTFIKFYFCNIDDYDIVIIEHGGTYRCDEENFTTYIIEYLVKHYETYNIFISPIMSVGGEHKTKNIQYSVLNIYENFKSRLIILRDLNNYYVEKYILKKIYNRLQTRNVENVVSLPWVKDVFFLQNYLHDDIYSFLKNIFNLKSINKLDNLVIKSPSHEINIYILTQHKSNVFNYDYFNYNYKDICYKNNIKYNFYFIVADDKIINNNKNNFVVYTEKIPQKRIDDIYVKLNKQVSFICLGNDDKLINKNFIILNKSILQNYNFENVNTFLELFILSSIKN